MKNNIADAGGQVRVRKMKDDTFGVNNNICCGGKMFSTACEMTQ